MTTLLLVLALAHASPVVEPSATPTPGAKPPINILLSRPDAEPAPRGGSLSEVAKHIKLKLPANQPRVLTNATVKQLAEGVELTTGVAGPRGSAAVPAGVNEDGKKAKWQQRYRSAIERVHRLEADVKSLEARASGLERDFYAHDDPVYRDSVIKPAWDRAVSDLQATRADLEGAEKQPDEVLNAARRDGALPGWFRGLDVESSPSSPAQQAQPGRPGQPARPTPKPTPVPPNERPVGPA
ncbi:MAG: hypothetical protein LAO05_05420 [Acidobacteriia bacterium]|nr:hypothetical protein [Terriglobia bacterium]